MYMLILVILHQIFFQILRSAMFSVLRLVALGMWMGFSNVICER